MRRGLIATVAASVTMVLLAMLVPMAVLLRSYALEDRLSRAALEVQATETVVALGQDPGAVAQYVDRINRRGGVETTVLYPDGTFVGPSGEQDSRVLAARATGQASVDDIDGGAEFLVPVSLGGSTPPAEITPVIRVQVLSPGLESGILRSWLLLVLLGLALLVGALVLADRLGRSMVTPVRLLAEHARQLGGRTPPAPVRPSGPAEVRELAVAMNGLVARIEVLLERERQQVSDLSHRLRTPMTALRLRVDSLPGSVERERLSTDLVELQRTVDHVVREARRSEREGLVAWADAAAVLGERARFWAPLAEDQGRELVIEVADGPLPVRAGEEDLVALLDVLLDNVFTHTPEDAPVRVSLQPGDAGGAVLVVEDGGPGYPAGVDVADRGASGAGSTGLGLAIVDQTAAASGGGLELGRSSYGGARAVVRLGPPGP